MINVFDCETYEYKNNVYIYCLSYSIEDEVYSIYKQNKKEDIIIKFFEKIIYKIKENKIIFYIHNINFDGMLILESVFNNNLIFDLLIKDNNIYMIKIKYLDSEIEFRCSYKIIPISLKNLSKLIEKNLKISKTIFPYKFVNEKNLNYVGEVPKKKFFNEDLNNEDYLNYINNKKIFDLKKETENYCENDVKLTLNILKNLINIMDKKYINLLKNSYSSPSLSYKIFFKYWNSKKINKKILKEEDLYIRKSYFGGRCEVFGNPNKKEKIHYFDFSGMYEQCMLEKFPIKNGKFVFENLDYKNIGFHSIKFKSDMIYPILPHHSEDKKLIFSNGIFVGCYWYEEIILFIENGGEILEIYSSYVFEDSDYVFKDFIKEFSEIKKKGGIYRVFGKLIINSLYGSFAMNEKEYESFVCFSEKEAELLNEKTDVIEHFKKNKCHILKIIKNKKSEIILNKKEKKWSSTMSTRNVVYASAIASKARIKLYKALKEVIKSGGRIFYCDTDSIAAGYINNNVGSSFGEVTWNEIWEDAVFIAPKFYGYKKNNEEIIKIKGISKKQFNLKELKNAFLNNKKSLKYKKELIFYKKNFRLKQNYIEKIIFINNYNKRIFSADKKYTIPLTTHPINE